MFEVKLLIDGEMELQEVVGDWNTMAGMVLAATGTCFLSFRPVQRSVQEGTWPR